MPGTTSTATKTRKPASRATRAANATQPPASSATLSVVGGQGKSTTGDNGVKTRAQIAKEKAAADAAAGTKPAAKGSAKPTVKPDLAAKPAKADEPAAAPKLNAKRVVASALVGAGAKLVQSYKWPEGVDAEQATAWVSKWLAYLPECEWPTDVLGERSDAGRRSKQS